MIHENAAGWNLENSYEQLPKQFHTAVHPTEVRNPQLITFNEQLALELGLQPEFFKSKKGIETLSGNKVPFEANPLAQAYAGHQFGNFTMLGDGRAILIGEQLTPNGDKFDIQLKGAGRTPYSRGGDGRAGLGPMLREYIMSEAMHALGIPTTRGLAVVATGENILRETAYKGAILTRVASSHLRVGTFQFATLQEGKAAIQSLADYTIMRHPLKTNSSKNPYLELLKAVIERQASLIAKWQLVGFIHGVMNTDNMTISGETIDYGPCAFMDTYDPATVFSSIDEQGRYAYGNQPTIGHWNLTRFAETLLPLLHSDQDEAIQIAKDALTTYPTIFNTHWISGMRAKLGIFNEKENDKKLITDLLEMMKTYQADFTNTFIALTFDSAKSTALFDSEEFKEWKNRWLDRLRQQTQSRSDSKKLMRNSNPAVIPRNHLVEEALSAAVEREDYTIMENLSHILSTPFAHTKEKSQYQTVPDNAAPYRTYCGT